MRTGGLQIDSTRYTLLAVIEVIDNENHGNKGNIQVEIVPPDNPLVGCKVIPVAAHCRKLLRLGVRSHDNNSSHDDVIKWRHFPRYWPFVRGSHRSPVNSPHKGQWRGALLFSLIWVWINGWVNNREAGDLRRHRAHCDVIVMPRK